MEADQPLAAPDTETEARGAVLLEASIAEERPAAGLMEAGEASRQVIAKRLLERASRLSVVPSSKGSISSRITQSSGSGGGFRLLDVAEGCPRPPGVPAGSCTGSGDGDSVASRALPLWSAAITSATSGSSAAGARIVLGGGIGIGREILGEDGLRALTLRELTPRRLARKLDRFLPDERCACRSANRHPAARRRRLGRLSDRSVHCRSIIGSSLLRRRSGGHFLRAPTLLRVHRLGQRPDRHPGCPLDPGDSFLRRSRRIDDAGEHHDLSRADPALGMRAIDLGGGKQRAPEPREPSRPALLHSEFLAHENDGARAAERQRRRCCHMSANPHAICRSACPSTGRTPSARHPARARAVARRQYGRIGNRGGGRLDDRASNADMRLPRGRLAQGHAAASSRWRALDRIDELSNGLQSRQRGPDCGWQ